MWKKTFIDFYQSMKSIYFGKNDLIQLYLKSEPSPT